jgi:hypothetical protein
VEVLKTAQMVLVELVAEEQVRLLLLAQLLPLQEQQEQAVAAAAVDLLLVQMLAE